MIYRVFFHDDSHLLVEAVSETQARHDAIEEIKEILYGVNHMGFKELCQAITIKAVEPVHGSRNQGLEDPHPHEIHRLHDDGCPHHED